MSFILFNFLKSGIDDVFPGGEISQGKIVQNVWQLNHLARIHDDVAVISFFFFKPIFSQCGPTNYLVIFCYMLSLRHMKPPHLLELLLVLGLVAAEHSVYIT